MTNKIFKPRSVGISTLETDTNKIVKAESKMPSLSDDLTQSPRERRDARRNTALAQADAAVALRHKPKEKPNGKE